MANIIGCKVVHSKWGIGVVDDVTENVLCIRFLESPEGDVTKKFIFPNAIKEKHVVGYDEHVNSLINELIGERKCSICGSRASGLVNVDGRRYCSSCKKTFTATCCSCRVPHYRLGMDSVYDSVDTIRTELICQACAPGNSFKCKKCESRYLNINHARGKWAGRDICIACAEDIEKRCHYCGTTFEEDQGEPFFLDDELTYVCPDCLDSKTFECSRCGARELLENRIDTKYVPSSQMICDACVTTCSVCNETIVIGNEKSAFGISFCPDCWENKATECTCCGENFLPQQNGNKLCPDCMEMEAYISRLKKVDYLSDTYKELRFYQLEYWDRCELFTRLYEHCGRKLGGFYPPATDKPFHFLVLDFVRYKAVVTYLSSSVPGKVRYSTNVTMSEILKKREKVLPVEQ